MLCGNGWKQPKWEVPQRFSIQCPDTRSLRSQITITLIDVPIALIVALGGLLFRLRLMSACQLCGHYR